MYIFNVNFKPALNQKVFANDHYIIVIVNAFKEEPVFTSSFYHSQYSCTIIFLTNNSIFKLS